MHLKTGHRLRGLALGGILALAAMAAAAAETVPSPLNFRARDDAAPGPARSRDAGERSLDVDRAALGLLKAVGRGAKIRIERFPVFPGVSADLDLERFEVATPDARVRLQTDHGSETLPLPDIAHFRGTLESDPDSRVYVAAHVGFLVATVRSGAGLAYLGPDGPAAGAGETVRHVLRTDDSEGNRALAPTEWHCDTEELPAAPADDPRPDAPSIRPSGALEAASANAASLVQVATVSIETDQELLARFGGNVVAMSAYVTTLIGQMAVIYERDVSVTLVVNAIQAWSSTDPYSATSPRAQLDEVGDWWHANRPRSAYPRTIVHYLSGKPVTGGVAWLGVLCQGDFSQGGHWGGGYGVTQINGAYPASLWDLIGVAHEIGHNFGSPHTHCYVPEIDKCHGSESGCYAGPTVNPGPRGGTIMSYCHLLPGGFGNIDIRFHERCIAESMLPEIASVTCLSPLAPPAVTPASFYTLTPCRVLDTRAAASPYGGPALAANSERLLALSGRCEIPSTARAVSANVTATGATAPGNLRLYAGGTAAPLASAVNYRVSQTRANSGLFPLGTGGNLAIRCDQASGIVHAIIDVNGYFQ